MIEMAKELLRYRELMVAFTERNIKIKYKQTFMGLLWAIFMPTVILLSGIVVKSGLAMLSGRSLDLTEIASISVKSLPWAFFVGALKFSVGSLTSNINLVSKIYFPRMIFPLSYMFSQAFDFMIAAFVFSFVLIYVKIGVSLQLLWLPLILGILFLLTAGFAMILSCGNLFYRDVRYIVDVIITFAIFFTPVFYEVAMFPKYETLLLLNPMAAILEAINTVVVLHQSPHPGWLLYAGAWALGSFLTGWYVFYKAEPLFADNI